MSRPASRLPGGTWRLAGLARLALALTLPIMSVIWAGPVLAQAPAVARANPAQSQQLIIELGQQAVTTLRQPGVSLEQREAAFRNLLGQKFDLPFIARFVLGRHWQDATADQQEEYLSLFSEFVLRNYSSMLGGYVDERLEVLSSVAAGQRDVIVSSRITGGARQPFRVDWRVRLNDLTPQIIDVSAEGVSMSITQRDEFSNVVKRNGIEGLLEVLRARVLGLPAEGPE